MSEILSSNSYEPVAPGALPLPATSNSSALVVAQKPFPHNLPQSLRLVLGQNGKAYSVRSDAGNLYALPVGGKQLNSVIDQIAHEHGLMLRHSNISEINHQLQSYAEASGIVRDVWFRVAQITGGIEIDLGDKAHTRVRIAAGNVEILEKGSETLFYRTSTSRPMTVPADSGDIKQLKQYLNLHPVSSTLLIAWLTYTLAHPKTPASKYIILVLQGNQGTGKTFLCQLILALIDPSVVGVRLMPSNEKDLAIAGQNAHVLCFDNLRGIKPSMADILCVAATGGALGTRQLYSDADQQIHHLHVALVLNGIHSLIEQPDLAQRCLPIELLPLTEGTRKTEAQLSHEFHLDLPAIQRGLFDLIAEILRYLPAVEVTNPERMLDFVHWLAAMEQAWGAPVGAFQGAYSDALSQGQRDSLLDNTLASAIVEFAETEIDNCWSGTPTDLLANLNKRATRGTQRSRDWPLNAIALSKRLRPLLVSLLSQGIRVDLHRGKHRTISINKSGVKND